MRPIKFRGVMYGGNEKVYGDLVHENGHTYIINVAREHHRVYENSVAQLVGYDVNGKEVYEGDTVLRYDSEEEFIEAPENGVLREVVLYTQVNPDLEAYYCLVKEDD